MHPPKTAKILPYANSQPLKNLARRIFQAKTMLLSQSTPYHVIGQYQHALVRYYPAGEKKYHEPIVFVPPLAVTVSIYDLYPYRSMIQHMQNSGFEVYLLDWGKLSYQHRELNFMSFIDDIIPNCLKMVQEHSQSPQYSLHGWSMGGLFVTLYSALHQPTAVKNLMVLGSPIDSFLTGWHGKLAEKLHHLLQRHPKVAQTIYEGKIPKQLIQTPGKINALVFKLIDLPGWYRSQKRLLQNLHDVKLLQEHSTMGQYLNHMVDYPGGINQDMLLHIWLQNPLKTGEIHLHGQHIALKNIRCSLLVGAGSRDTLVAKEAVQPLTQLTSSQDVTFTLIPGGHMGIMSNQESADEFWPMLTTWLQQRSTTT